MPSLLADELRAAKHVAPLIVAAKLHVAAIFLEKMVEIIALHDHVVELKEAQTLFHALLVALGTEHVVHAEACTDLAQKLNIIEIEQPVGVVDHDGLVLAEFDEAFHLVAEALGVVVDIRLGEHLTHIGAARGIADHRGTPADERDRLVAGHLQAFHERERHEVTGRQAVRRAVKADIKASLSVVDQVVDLLLIGDLRDKAAPDKLFVNLHQSVSFLFFFRVIRINSL